MVQVVGVAGIDDLPQLEGDAARGGIGHVAGILHPGGEPVGPGLQVAPRIIPVERAADVGAADSRNRSGVAGGRRKEDAGLHRIGARIGGQADGRRPQRGIRRQHRRRHIGQENLIGLAVAGQFRRLDHDDGRQQLAARRHLARGVERGIAAAGSHNLEAVQPVRTAVVHVRHLEGDLVFRFVHIPGMGQLNVFRRKHGPIGRIPAVFGAVQLDGEQIQGLDSSGQRPCKLLGVPNPDFPCRLHQGAVRLGPVEIQLVGGARRRDGAGQLGIMPGVGGHGPVGPGRTLRAGPFAQANLDGGRPARGQVRIGEPPGQGILLPHVAGRDGIGLLPRGHARGIPRGIAIEIGEHLPRIVVAIGVAVHIRLKPRPVAVGLADGRVVVGSVAVLDAVPDLAHGRIRAHHHAVFRTGQDRAVGGRPLHVAPGRLGVQIEGLLERVVHRRGATALQEGPRGHQVKPVLQPGRGRAIVIVRPVLNRRRVDVRDLPDAQHVCLERDIARRAGPGNIPTVSAIALLAGRSDLVPEGGARRHRGNHQFPPVRAVGAVAHPGRLDHARGGISRGSARTFRIGRAIGRVINEYPVARHLRRLDPQIERGVGRIRDGRPELGIAGTLAILGPARTVPNPRHGVLPAPIVAARGQIGGKRGSNGRKVCLRPRRTDLVARRIRRREFLAKDALHERRLLISQKDVVRKRGRIVAHVAQRVGRRVQVHAAIETEQDIVRRTIHPRHKGEIRRPGHARQVDRIGKVRRVGVRQPVGVESRIAVGSVLADHPDGVRHLAVLVDRDRFAAKARPHRGRIRILVAKDEIAAGRHRHALQRGSVRVEPPAVPGIVVEISIRSVGAAPRVREAHVAGDVPRLPVGIVVVQHHQHRHLVGIRAATLPPIQTLPRHVVGIAPHAALIAPAKLLVAVQQIGHAPVVPLAQIGGVRPARKGPAALPQRLGMMVAVRVQQPQPGAQEIKRMLQLLAGRIVVVVTLRMHHPRLGGKPAVARGIVTCQPVPHAAQPVVQLVAKIVVHQPHARGPIAIIPRRRAQVLAKQHRVVARHLRAETTVAVIAPVAVAVRHVELPLRIAAIPRAARVVVVGSEEIVRHMLHRVQPQTVHLRPVHQPAHAPAQIAPHILREETGALRDQVGRQPVVRAKADVEISVGVARPVPGIPLGGRHVGVRHPVVEFRIVRMPHKTGLGIIVALVHSKIVVGRFMRNVNQVGQPEVHHLPRAGPVPAVVPLPVEAILRHPDMEILRHHARIHIHRCALVVPRHIEGPVVHDVVQIHPDAKAVGGLDQIQQVGFRAIPRRHAAPVPRTAQIKRIAQIIAYGQPSAAFGRRRQPQ